MTSVDLRKSDHTYDARVTVPVASLLEPGPRTPRIGTFWVYAEDIVEHGDSMSYPTFTYPFKSAPGAVQVYQVPLSLWGDYNGSLLEKSNYQVLVEEYQDDLIEVGAPYGTSCLWLRLDRCIPTRLRDMIAGLAESPLLDEDHLAQLEIDQEHADWLSFGRADLMRELNKRDCGAIKYAVVDSAYAEARFNPHTMWEPETAVSGYFTDAGTKYLVNLLVEQESGL